MLPSQYFNIQSQIRHSYLSNTKKLVTLSVKALLFFFFIRHKKRSRLISWAYRILQSQCLEKRHQISLSLLPISKLAFKSHRRMIIPFLKLSSFIPSGWSLLLTLPCSLPGKLLLKDQLKCHLQFKIFPKSNKRVVSPSLFLT